MSQPDRTQHPAATPGPPTEHLALPLLGLDEAVLQMLTEAHWQAFERDGYLDLGPTRDLWEIAPLITDAQRLGAGELAGRLGDVELFTFHEVTHHPIFHEVANRFFGPEASVAVLRMGIEGAVPEYPVDRTWRQAAVDLVTVDREELATIVSGLGSGDDRHTVEVVPGSHRLGLIERGDGPLSADDAERHPYPRQAERTLTIEPGSAMLLHRWLLHRRGGGPAAVLQLVDGQARNPATGYAELPLLRGAPIETPYPSVAVLESAVAALTEQFEAAETYARSVEAAHAQVIADRVKLETYAQSLLADRDALAAELQRRVDCEVQA